jgi:hypothetical protein
LNGFSLSFQRLQNCSDHLKSNAYKYWAGENNETLDLQAASSGWSRAFVFEPFWLRLR